MQLFTKFIQWEDSGEFSWGVFLNKLNQYEVLKLTEMFVFHRHLLKVLLVFWI